MKLALISLCGLVILAGCNSGQPVDGWVALPGGCFVMGEDPSYSEEGPPTEVCVDAFELARYEVTNAEFAEFVQETGYLTRAERGWRADEFGGPGVDMLPGSAVFVPPHGPPRSKLDWWKLVEGASWRSPNGPGSEDAVLDDNPVVHITREDAEAFASWAGGRLPTEAEWEFAARAVPGGEVSPWSDAEYTAQSNRANTWQGVFPVQNTNGDGYAGIAPVGSFPENAFGLHDMIGNVWEWTATPYAPSHAAKSRRIAGERGFDPGQPEAAVGTIKGGSFLCADNFCARFRPAARQAQDLTYGTSHIGFRMARDARVDAK